MAYKKHSDEGISSQPDVQLAALITGCRGRAHYFILSNTSDIALVEQDTHRVRCYLLLNIPRGEREEKKPLPMASSYFKSPQVRPPRRWLSSHETPAQFTPTKYAPWQGSGSRAYLDYAAEDDVVRSIALKPGPRRR